MPLYPYTAVSHYSYNVILISENLLQLHFEDSFLGIANVPSCVEPHSTARK